MCCHHCVVVLHVVSVTDGLHCSNNRWIRVQVCGDTTRQAGVSDLPSCSLQSTPNDMLWKGLLQSLSGWTQEMLHHLPKLPEKGTGFCWYQRWVEVSCIKGKDITSHWISFCISFFLSNMLHNFLLNLLQVSKKSSHLRSCATTLRIVVAGWGSYDPWMIISQHVGTPLFTAPINAWRIRRK